MSSFPLVYKGQLFVPNLDLENSLRRMANFSDSILNQENPPARSFAPGITIIEFLNGSNQTIAAYTAVRILQNLPPQSSDELDGRWEGRCLVIASPAVDENEPWGIALDDVEPQEYGRMALTGTVPAFFSGSGRKVTPTQDGLVAGDAGSAWVVAKPAESYPEGESFPGIILLGGGSGSAAPSYNGMHKLVLITDNSNPEAPIYKVCVCDGATYNPQTHTSGKSRVEVNGVSFDLDAEVFELSDKTAYIYVKLTAGTQNSQAQVAYQSGDRLPASSDTETSYLIGRAVYNDGAFTTQQDHVGTATNGVIHIPWGTICNA